ATRVAPTLDAAGWRDANEGARYSEGQYPPRHVERCAALLAERDRVAAGLSAAQRELLLRIPRARSCNVRGMIDLAGEGSQRTARVLGRLLLARPHQPPTMVQDEWSITDFGREIARVLAGKEAGR
ncbi:MAG TPA: hypothetical protein VJP45_00200, partial [Candidatus Limnocylindria bacterium]|nr:hypothetical protein [Candidatus Limnocylindria bacterium]